MNQYSTVAVRAVKKAGDMIAREFGKFKRTEAHFKKYNETVTRLDRASEKLILRDLQKSFPLHSYISEEGGGHQRASEYLWAVDPIDGTFNFILKLPFFCVVVGLIHKKKPILGIVYDPVAKVLFTAEPGKGAFRNGKKIHVSHVSDFKHSFNTFSHGKTHHSIIPSVELYKRFRLDNISFRHLGSISLELCAVAEGRTDSAMGIGLSGSWDLAAGALIVKEAGGRVTDEHGDPWIIDSPTIITSNGKIHRSLLKEVTGVLKRNSK